MLQNDKDGFIKPVLSLIKCSNVPLKYIHAEENVYIAIRLFSFAKIEKTGKSFVIEAKPSGN